MRRFVFLIVMAVFTGFYGCSDKAAPEAANGSGKGGEGKPPVAVEVVKVAPVELSNAVEVVGTLSPKFESVVRAEVKSRVTDVYVTQWVNVTPGKELMKSDTRDIEQLLASTRARLEGARSQEEAALAQGGIARAGADTALAQEEAGKASILEAQVGLDRAEREHQRLTKLYEGGLVTRQNLDEGVSARDAARARVEAAKSSVRAAGSQVAAAKAQIPAAEAAAKAARSEIAAASEEVKRLEILLSKAVVRSPMHGVVAERFVNVGDLPGDGPLFHIVDNRVMNLTLSVPAKDQAAVRLGQTITFTTDALPGESFTGKILFVNPAASGADRSVEVLAEVPNPEGKLKGGQFAKAKITTGTVSGALTVPRAALSSWDMVGKSAEVFVVASGAAKKRRVSTGMFEGDQVALTSGVSAGEEVVARGGFNLKDGDKVEVVKTGAK